MLDYTFRNLDITDEEIPDELINEGFSFGKFNSMNEMFYLISRDAPSPEEKANVESIPYMQGVIDFSRIYGERYFENREITYKLMIFNTPYINRKTIENNIKRCLMMEPIQPIIDTHDQGLHWLGKCKEVSVEDNEENKTLVVTVTFDCYPFAIKDEFEGADIWDTVDFPDYVFQENFFKVDGQKRIILINLSSNTIETSFTVDGFIFIKNQNGSVEYTTGDYENTPFNLIPGENVFQLFGDGTINFKFFKEVMI